MPADNSQTAPVAIGGLGGSGTRIGAELLKMQGRYIGSDLNESLDNLWFTLLFKRRDIMVETEGDFEELATLFWTRMKGQTEVSPASRLRIVQLAAHSRIQHDRAWLQERARLFLQASAPGPIGTAWGWKEPNTHIVIDRLFRLYPPLRYIHFLRHPLDMALSANQNQLENWGPIFLGRRVKITPRDSLAYWCAAHRRITSIAEAHSGRVLFVDFDCLCRAVETEYTRIAQFLGEASKRIASQLTTIIHHDRPGRGRHRGIDLRLFEASDLEFVRSLGYAIG